MPSSSTCHAADLSPRCHRAPRHAPCHCQGAQQRASTPQEAAVQLAAHPLAWPARTAAGPGWRPCCAATADTAASPAGAPGPRMRRQPAAQRSGRWSRASLTTLEPWATAPVGNGSLQLHCWTGQAPPQCETQHPDAKAQPEWRRTTPSGPAGDAQQPAADASSITGHFQVARQAAPAGPGPLPAARGAPAGARCAPRAACLGLSAPRSTPGGSDAARRADAAHVTAVPGVQGRAAYAQGSPGVRAASGCPGKGQPTCTTSSSCCTMPPSGWHSASGRSVHLQARVRQGGPGKGMRAHVDFDACRLSVAFIVCQLHKTASGIKKKSTTPSKD
jgi:hypothetical protein